MSAFEGTAPLRRQIMNRKIKPMTKGVGVFSLAAITPHGGDPAEEFYTCGYFKCKGSRSEVNAGVRV